MGKNEQNSKAEDAEPQDISASAYATQTRELMDAVDRIRDIGTQLDIDLPRVVVIGNQSAGKSSLIEAIAGINVPRGQGTCTRCPSEIRLRHNEGPWQCSISLRFEYDQAGDKLDHCRIVTFGDTFGEVRLVELKLRQAQLAILSPDTDANYFLGLDVESITNRRPDLPFSKNTICVELAGPHLTDLTFVDLPGIISSTSDEEQTWTIDFIRSMVHDSIVGNCLIMLVITMKEDMESQSAIMEARKVDPEGRRTIGVLTKPDTLDTGEDRQWMPVVRNESAYRLTHGYFVTKQPALKDVERGITFTEARSDEKHFFRHHEPWGSKDLDVIRGRMGTQSLTSNLSILLSERIRATLPAIIKTIHKSLDDVHAQIAGLPAEPSDQPVWDMIRLCQQFWSTLQGRITGAGGKELVQFNKSAYRKFKACIRGTAPAFMPYTQEEVAWNSPYQDPEFLQEEYLDDVQASIQQNLDDVRTHIDSSKARELPFNVPFSAKVDLIVLSMVDWETFTKCCLNDIVPKVTSIAQEIAKSVFGRFDHGVLPNKVAHIIAEHLDRCGQETEGVLDKVIAMEKEPYTQNEKDFAALRQQLIAQYAYVRGTRVKEATESPGDSASDLTPDYRPQVASSARLLPNRLTQTQLTTSIINNLESLGIPNVTAQDFPKLTIDSSYSEEIAVMAEVRAYIQIAYKRIIDTVPRTIDHLFVKPLADVLNEALIKGLDIHGPHGYEHCKAYLEENPFVGAKREQLRNTKARLGKAQEVLGSLQY